MHGPKMLQDSDRSWQRARGPPRLLGALVSGCDGRRLNDALTRGKKCIFQPGPLWQADPLDQLGEPRILAQGIKQWIRL